MQVSTVKQLLNTAGLNQEIQVSGWVRTFRSNRFIALNDGSSLQSIQCVVDFENTDEELLKKVNTGAALKIQGLLTPSQGKGQAVEIQVKTWRSSVRPILKAIPFSPRSTHWNF